MTARQLQQRLRRLGDPKRADGAARYFKTGPGESGEGLRFLGLDAATLRRVAREFRDLPLAHAEAVLQSPWHDERAAALLILGWQYPRAEADVQQAIYESYLANTAHVNSWALVDCSAPPIVGAHLLPRSRKPLDRLAKSASLWERRIAMVATQHLIRHGEFADTLRIAKALLHDEEDLIHKAAGWMLREVGDRAPATLDAFLLEHYRNMPRTMLRYAIEKMPPRKRRAYLHGTI